MVSWLCVDMRSSLDFDACTECANAMSVGEWKTRKRFKSFSVLKVLASSVHVRVLNAMVTVFFLKRLIPSSEANRNPGWFTEISESHGVKIADVCNSLIEDFLWGVMQARDAFFKCVEADSGHTTPTEIASVGLLYPAQCKSARAFYEQNCRSTWVS